MDGWMDGDVDVDGDGDDSNTPLALSNRQNKRCQRCSRLRAAIRGDNVLDAS